MVFRRAEKLTWIVVTIERWIWLLLITTPAIPGAVVESTT